MRRTFEVLFDRDRSRSILELEGFYVFFYGNVISLC